jgi:hypothetical protein
MFDPEGRKEKNVTHQPRKIILCVKRKREVTQILRVADVHAQSDHRTDPARAAQTPQPRTATSAVPNGGYQGGQGGQHVTVIRTFKLSMLLRTESVQLKDEQQQNEHQTQTQSTSYKSKPKSNQTQQTPNQSKPSAQKQNKNNPTQPNSSQWLQITASPLAPHCDIHLAVRSCLS